MTAHPVEAIPLRRKDGSIRAFALVDAEDFERFGDYRWCLNVRGYVTRTTPTVDGVRRCVLLHRVIMGCTPGDGTQVDHRNGDPLDNRRENLRVLDHSGNGANRHTVRGVSRHRGVCRDGGRWRAYAFIRGQRHYLGLFADEDAAGRAASAFRREHMPTSEMDR